VVGAIKHGRYGLGCDVVPEYVNVAWERLHLLRAGLLRMRPMDRPVYDPTKPNGGHR
jgi:adenine-specific DNA-methyltransferase